MAERTEPARHDFLNKTVLRRIDYRVARLGRKYHLPRQDREDIRQEFCLAVFRAGTKFDPEQSTPDRYVRMVLNRCYKHFVRKLARAMENRARSGGNGSVHPNTDRRELMSLLEQVHSGRRHRPPRLLIYGTEGIGKSTLAAGAPAPIFLPTEDGLDQIECDSFPLAKSFDDVLSCLTVLSTEDHKFKTAVIDSADWLERLVFDHVCKQYGAKSIEKVDGGYGKGYVHALTQWRQVIDALRYLREEKGMVVVLLAHAKIEKFADPQSMKPAELMRVLNTAGRGTVLTETRLRRHRNRAGYTIGDARTVNLFRYAAWLTIEHFTPKEDPQDYAERKHRQAERNAESVRAAQDIGELPKVVDPERKAAAEDSFRTFCETYFRDVFYLPWSDDHLKVIEKIERAVRTGGLFAMAMPRGSGKTVLCQTAVVWSALIGATPFVTLIAASADRAKDLLENTKTWLETNRLLAEDFPEVAYPIKCLERITNRQKGQKHQGEPTRIEWSADRVVLPTVHGSKASGVVISCSGMKGSDIRGQNHARADGQVVRPQLVMVDDPQTTESAWSPSQSQRREAILAGDVLGMAGPGKKIAGLMACTVIRPDDMADNILE